MSVTVQWDNNDHTVIRYDFIGKWTWDEYHKALMNAFEMFATVRYDVDVIADFTKSGMPPTNTVSGFSPSTKKNAPNAGHAVVVLKNRFFESLVNIFSKIYSWNGKKTMASSTVEEARIMLALLRQKNPAYKVDQTDQVTE